MNYKIFLIRFQTEYLDDDFVYDNVIVEEQIQQPHNIDRAAGRRTRQSIIDQYFT